MTKEQMTIGIRGTGETKERLDRLTRQQGISQKELLERLIDSYEVSQTRESLTQIKELEQLKHHLARVEEIYVGIVKATQDRQEDDAGKISTAEQESLQAKVAAQQAREDAAAAIEQAKEETDRLVAETTLEREQTKAEIAQVQENLQQALVAREQSAKLAVLAEQAATVAEEKASRYVELASQAEGLQKELTQTTNQLNTIKNELKNAKKTITELTPQAATASELTQQVAELKDALQESEYQKKLAVLESKQQCLNEMKELQENLAKCREEKASLEVQLIKTQNQEPAKNQKNSEKS